MKMGPRRAPLICPFPIAEDVGDLGERGFFERPKFFRLRSRDEVSHSAICELAEQLRKLRAAGGWAATGKRVEKQVQDQAVRADRGREGRPTLGGFIFDLRWLCRPGWRRPPADPQANSPAPASMSRTCVPLSCRISHPLA